MFLPGKPRGQATPDGEYLYVEICGKRAGRWHVGSRPCDDVCDDPVAIPPPLMARHGRLRNYNTKEIFSM
jgi:hypothetical protein